MDEQRNKITLREASPSPENNLLERIKEDIDRLYDCGVNAAGNFISGKGEQEVGKAAELKASVYSKLANLDLERQRLINERDKMLRDDRQRMYELQTQRLEAVVNNLVRLKELGVDVNLEVVAAKLLKVMETGI